MIKFITTPSEEKMVRAINEMGISKENIQCICFESERNRWVCFYWELNA